MLGKTAPERAHAAGGFIEPVRMTRDAWKKIPLDKRITLPVNTRAVLVEGRDARAIWRPVEITD